MVVGELLALSNNRRAGTLCAVGKAPSVSIKGIKSPAGNLISSYRTRLDDVAIQALLHAKLKRQLIVDMEEGSTK